MEHKIFTSTQERRMAMREKLAEVCDILDPCQVDEFLWENGFYTAPASTKYHGAYEGGLFDHSWAVYEALEEITEGMKLDWWRPESPFIIGLFHDICKTDKYQVDNSRPYTVGEPVRYEYKANPAFGEGHGLKSIAILSMLIQLTEQEMFCIRYHMGAYEKDQWAEYDKAIHQYANVLWTHTADMVASKVWDV